MNRSQALPRTPQQSACSPSLFSIAASAIVDDGEHTAAPSPPPLPASAAFVTEPPQAAVSAAATRTAMREFMGKD
jgi:hypothetical protein